MKRGLFTGDAGSVAVETRAVARRVRKYVRDQAGGPVLEFRQSVIDVELVGDGQVGGVARRTAPPGDHAAP
ncbi:hypothetical protein LCGC14_2494060, partial [marine sediment metagenome]